MSVLRRSDIPFKAYFSFSFPIHRLQETPALLARPKDWADRYLVPVTAGMDGVEPFAKVYAGWSDGGMWSAFRVDQKQRPRPRPERFWTGDACEVWIDTRGSRDAHKPTPYCHHFYLMPDGPQGGVPPIGFVRMLRPSSGGREPDLSRVRVARRTMDSGYAIEAFFPAEVLHGYDPHDSPVIGFCYNVCSVSMGRMHLSLSEGFRVWEDPSMWASCTLTE
jgi:hypothetical protein